MFPAEIPSVVELSRGDLWRCQPRAALRLRVIAGRAWVTWPGEADDHFLDPGDAIELPAGRLALVGAESGLRLGVAPAGLPRRGGGKGMQRLWRGVLAVLVGRFSALAGRSPRRS